MSEDMSDMMQKMSEMLKNNEIPDNIKMIMNNLASQASSDSSSHNNSSNIEEKTTEERFQDVLSSFINMNSQGNNHETVSKSNFDETNSTNSSNGSSDIPNFDLNTMLKMKSIIDTMNKQQNDPRANLLRSLKPYLKPSRKDKVDQYIKLFNMGKVFEVLNPLGGEKKNDV